MVINGQIYATSDMEVVDNAAKQGYKLIYIGDQMEIPQGYNFINAICFTPDYKTMTFILEGNDAGTIESYIASLTTPASEEMLAVLLGALHQNVSVVIYFPQETLQLKYPYILLQYLWDRFGIRVGDKNNQPFYNPSFDMQNMRLLYLYRIITWQEFILNVDALDPIVLCKLREDLCKPYNIPANIKDEDMVVKVQEIKDQLIESMKPRKKQLFTRVEKEKK